MQPGPSSSDRLFVFFSCPLASCLRSDLRPGQVMSWRLCINPFKLLFSSGQASCQSFCDPPPPQRVSWRALWFWNVMVTIINQHVRLLKHCISLFVFLYCCYEIWQTFTKCWFELIDLHTKKNVNICLKNVQKIACHLQCSLLKCIFVHLYMFVFKIITIYIDVSKKA